MLNEGSQFKSLQLTGSDIHTLTSGFIKEALPLAFWQSNKFREISFSLGS
jgi:hypothetical protein